MTRRDWIPAVFLLALSLFVISQAIRLPYSAEYGPGPGFLPLWLAGVVGGLSLLLLVRSTGAPRPRKPFIANPAGMKSAAMVAGLYLAYILLLQTLGLLVALAIFLLILIKVVERRSLLASVITAVAGSVSCYLLFEVWLKVPLPIGILGI